MLRRFSKINSIIVVGFLVPLVVLCVASVYVATNLGTPAQEGEYGLHIFAHQLPEKPSTYVVLTTADSYVSSAISNLNQDVYVGSWGSTQIDDVLLANHTGNIEFNSNYYSIGLLSADPAPLIQYSTLLLLTYSWILWGIAAILVTLIILIKKRLTNQAKLSQK